MFLKHEKLVSSIYEKLDRYYRTNTFTPIQDWEDMRNLACVDIFSYMPDRFDSELHCSRWISKYVKFRFLNIVRNSKSKNIQIYPLREDDIENESYSKFICHNNYNDVYSNSYDIIKELPYRDKLLLKLRYIDKLPISVISRKMNVSRRTIYSKFKNIEAALKKYNDISI